MMCCDSQKRSMKRTNRWLTTGLVMFAALTVDLDGSQAFSPVSDNRPGNSVERRRHKRVASPQSPEEGPNRLSSGTDLKIAMSPSHINAYAPSVIGTVQTVVSITKSHPKVLSKIPNLPASSRAVSLGKHNRNSRMKRPKSRTSSPRLDSKTAALEHEGLLSKDQEKDLTFSIRSLRMAVRARDALVEKTDAFPTESEWANSCGLTVMQLRRVMYEGQQARTVLISCNRGLVISIAKHQFMALKYAMEAGGGVGTILAMQDLIQEGNLGLMQAAERFEAERGHRFSTYATYWIRQRILKSISDSSRIIRLPAHVHSFLHKINKAKKEITKLIGREPSTPELAHYMEISVDELEKYTSRTRNVISLESPLRRGGTMKEDRRTIGDLVASDAPTPEEDAQREYLKDDIRAVINELAERERDVLILRFGLENGEPMTVNQTAKHLGISSDRVRTIEARAINKLRSPQRNYRLKDYIGAYTEEEQQVKEEIRATPEKIWFF